MDDTAPFLAPGIAWLLLITFLVLRIALGVWWEKRSSGTTDGYTACRPQHQPRPEYSHADGELGDQQHDSCRPGSGLHPWSLGGFGYTLAGLKLLFFAPLAIRISLLMRIARIGGEFIRLRYGRSV